MANVKNERVLGHTGGCLQSCIEKLIHTTICKYLTAYFKQYVKWYGLYYRRYLSVSDYRLFDSKNDVLATDKGAS